MPHKFEHPHPGSSSEHRLTNLECSAATLAACQTQMNETLSQIKTKFDAVCQSNTEMMVRVEEHLKRQDMSAKSFVTQSKLDSTVLNAQLEIEKKVNRFLLWVSLTSLSTIGGFCAWFYFSVLDKIPLG